MNQLENVIADFLDEVARQDQIQPEGYPNTRNGVRLGLACLQDELDETHAEWHVEKRTQWEKTQIELTQAVAIGVRILRSMKDPRRSHYEIKEIEEK